MLCSSFYGAPGYLAPGMLDSTQSQFSLVNNVIEPPVSNPPNHPALAPPNSANLRPGPPNAGTDPQAHGLETNQRLRKYIDNRQKTAHMYRWQDYYEKLPELPDWGPIDQEGRHKYRYTELGELDPSISLDDGDIPEYLGSNPRPVRMWLQLNPPQTNHRTTNRLSARCRWSHCPIPSRAIGMGNFRLAFDEFPEETGARYDPYHCAGFMHLYCMEMAYDLVELCSSFDLRPDMRELTREQPNKLNLARGPAQLPAVFDAWQAVQQRLWQQHTAMRGLGVPRQLRNGPGGDYLYRALTDAMLANQVETRGRVRSERGGNNIGVHRGDLRKWVEGEEKMIRRMRKKRATAEAPDGAGGRVAQVGAATAPSACSCWASSGPTGTHGRTSSVWAARGSSSCDGVGAGSWRCAWPGSLGLAQLQAKRRCFRGRRRHDGRRTGRHGCPSARCTAVLRLPAQSQADMDNPRPIRSSGDAACTNDADGPLL